MLFQKNIRSSISEQNYHSVQDLLPSGIGESTHPLLFDPQTSGGLLFSVAQEDAHTLKTTLESLGFLQASIIGEIAEHSQGKPILNII